MAQPPSRMAPEGAAASRAAPRWSAAGAARAALLAALFFGAALVVYAPALRGPFLSDDHHYVRDNPYVKSFDVAEILDPRGPASSMVENWSPVHLLLHASAWRVFGEDVLGHHVLNLVLHAMASVGLVLLLRRSGARAGFAVAGGALFLLHPANVEAVAWISQLKSSSALVLSVGALLLHPARPLAAFVLFALALLAKPTAAFALPVAALLAFARTGAPEDTPERSRARASARWLALWALAFAAFAGIELGIFHRSGQDIHPVHPDPLVQARTIVTNGGRYLWMAATGRGLSAFHEPTPILSSVDPRFLASSLALAVLAVRAVRVLRVRRPEAAFWAWAAVSFAPISQVFPFLYPVADRYLYFILPGLVGGAVLAAQDAFAALVRARPAQERALAGIALAAAAGLALAFAVEARARARIWTSPALLFVDSATHYPDGVAASLLRARRAAQLGDADETAAELRAAAGRGFRYFEQITGDPAFAAVRGDPRVAAVLHEMAGWWVDRIRGLERQTQAELALLARAHVLRGERAEARAVLERAREMRGPADAAVRAQLAELGAAAGPPAAAEDQRPR